jgi:hypothetical protein
VAPGVIRTPMTEHRLQDERFRKMNQEMTPSSPHGHGRRHCQYSSFPVLTWR